MKAVDKVVSVVKLNYKELDLIRDLISKSFLDPTDDSEFKVRLNHKINMHIASIVNRKRIIRKCS